MTQRVGNTFIIIVVISVVCLGCDYIHTLRIENHTDDYLLVDPWMGYIMPCSVKWAYGFGGPHPDVVLTVTLRYSPDRQVAFQDKVPYHNDKFLGMVYDLILVSGTPDRCPQAISDHFFATVNNRSSDAFQVLWRGLPLGIVDKRSTTTFGPITGSINDLSYLTVSLSEPGNKPTPFWVSLSPKVEYNLGEVPEVQIQLEAQYGPNTPTP
jgi:hypothetical protein